MCLIVLVGAFAPRIGIVLLWLFTNQLTQAFQDFWVGLLGFVFLPFTTLIYAIVYQPVVGVDGFGWLLVGIGFVIDVANWVGGSRSRDRDRSGN